MAEFHIQLFAGAREAVGADSIPVFCDSPAKIGTIKAAMVLHYPQLEPFVTFGRMAFGVAFVDDSFVITSDSDQIRSVLALIPPVSGG